ncbi:MAG: TIGR04282 family arsenosugar biosynthesis glycosyltransferase, partial [Bacteroidia bacterium]
MQRALVIFQKNADLGKVKTRLAATLGDEKTMQVYQTLVNHTHRVACGTDARKWLYYSDRKEAGWQAQPDYTICVQSGKDLGERMCHALGDVFASGVDQALIIGTDCPELKAEILQEAFEALTMYDLVVGPADDGGYYLLGMNRLYATLFSHKKWSTDSVLSDTLQDAS